MKSDQSFNRFELSSLHSTNWHRVRSDDGQKENFWYISLCSADKLYWMLQGYFLRAPLTHFRTALQRAGRGWCWNSTSMLPCMPCAHAHEHARAHARARRIIRLFPLSLAVIFKIPLKSENAYFRSFLLHHFAYLHFFSSRGETNTNHFIFHRQLNVSGFVFYWLFLMFWICGAGKDATLDVPEL